MGLIIDEDVRAPVARLAQPFGAEGFDEYSTSRAHLERFCSLVAPLYRSFVRV